MKKVTPMPIVIRARVNGGEPEPVRVRGIYPRLREYFFGATRFRKNLVIRKYVVLDIVQEDGIDVFVVNTVPTAGEY